MPPTRTPATAAITTLTAAERSRQLWRMTAAQRERAMWAGELTLSQLTEWTRQRPDEVPRLHGELAWITMTTPEWAEVTR